MSRGSRRILFYSFALLFFAIAPILILYAYGYKYDFERKKFIETGAIQVKTYPKKARVYIDGKLLSKNTPTLIKGLLPKQHSLKIELDGFNSWTKKLEVYPGLVTKAESVLLFPSDIESVLVNEQETKKFQISPDHERVVFTTNNQENAGVWIQELKKGLSSADVQSEAIQLLKLETLNQKIKTEQKEELSYGKIQWSENSKYIIFKVEPANQWFLIDIQKPSDLTNLNDFLGDNASNLNWSTKNSENIYFTKDNNLFIFEWRSGKSNLFIENASDYYIRQNQIYFTLEPNLLIYKTDLNKSNITQVTFDKPSDVTITDIEVSGNDSMVVFSDNDDIYFIKNGLFEPVAKDVKNIEFSSDSKKLLVQTNYEIFVQYLDNIEGAPSRKKDEKILITRHSEQIKKALFLPIDYEHIIFEVNGEIKIIETDNRDTLNTVDLAKGNNLEIFFENNTLDVYYTGKEKLNNIEIGLR